MTNKADFDVLISGGSFAGLAVARGLSQAFGGDVRIAIVEQRDTSRPAAAADGRGFAIWTGTRHVLEALGVWDRLKPLSESVTRIEITDSALDDGVRPTRLTYDAVTSGGEPAVHVVPASALQAALTDAVLRDSAVTWFAPAEIVKFEASGSAARAELGDGRVLEARLAVSADGRASKLRDLAGIKTVGRGYGQTGIVATVSFSEPHGSVAVQHFLPGGPFAILPLKGNRACITWSAEASEAKRVLALDPAAFAQEIDQRIAGRFGDVTVEGAPQSWPLDVRLARSFIGTRLALVGDAAHGVHPIAGQGVNLALRDAAALVECVADAVRIGLDFADQPALERYQRWRRFDTTMSASLFDGLNGVFSIDGIFARAGRGVGLQIIDRLPAAKHTIIDEACGITGELPRMMRGEPV